MTFLDAIYLEVDGIRHDARECVAPAEHCLDDGRYTRLGRGEVLDLTFVVDGASCERVDLVADGFYMPL